ncbi:hypothetical protein ACF8FF_07075 [Pseudomonas sp. zjy_13]|uniref:hypothetical protein n=1 Tax=Pseudomonas sp. zjy_13 TaxID=3367263 RepID=UPI00370A6F43
METSSFEQLSTLKKWYLKGFVALFMFNIDRLALLGGGITIAIFIYPALYLKDLIGGVGGGVAGFLFFAATYYLFSRVIGFWIINPLVGVYGLHRVRSDFGPKTHLKVLEWVLERCEKPSSEQSPSLNIAELARAVGEHK